MDDKKRRQVQLNCLYEMFRDKIEENVIYIVYTENEGKKIDTTIDQLMSIAACSFTGRHFEPSASPQTPPLSAQICSNGKVAVAAAANETTSTSLAGIECNHNASRLATKTQQLTNAQDATPAGADEEDENDKLSIEEKIVKLQQSIDDLLLEKRGCHDKASQYLTRKMYPVTSYYSEMASQLNRYVERKTNKLVDLLLERSKDSNQIDLHGLNPIQARLVVSEFLRLRENKLMVDRQPETSIDIITGWGKHKQTQGQQIRPTIVALLRDQGREYYHLNKGALRVTIRR